jgi:hypothetical protein
MSILSWLTNQICSWYSLDEEQLSLHWSVLFNDAVNCRDYTAFVVDG